MEVRRASVPSLMGVMGANEERVEFDIGLRENDPEDLCDANDGFLD